jgi:mono/diheme cytochrome c family protein
MKNTPMLPAALVALLISGIVLATDVLRPRVPELELSAAHALQNPIERTPATVARGRELYHGKGFCVACHGPQGRGITGVDPALLTGALPTDFTDPRWQAARSDGELLWVLKRGSSGTAMASFVPSVLSAEEAWTVIHYVHTLATP